LCIHICEHGSHLATSALPITLPQIRLYVRIECLYRQLGNVGHQMGASVLLCHLVTADDNHDILHVANAGLNEAILCRDGEAIKINSLHAADKNKDERKRIVELRGFVTKVSKCFFISM